MPSPRDLGRFELLSLATLAAGPRSGADAAVEVTRRAGRRPGELDWHVHEALRRLAGDGLVRTRRGSAPRGRRKRYELTRKGRARLDAERREWLALARVAARAA